MQFFITALQRDRRLQLGLVLLILSTLLGITYWQNQNVDNPQASQNVSLPAQLKITSSAQVRVEENLEARVTLDTKGSSINTVTANFSYPTDKLEFKEIQTENSFVKIWFDKRAERGKILLTGALPSPGFSDSGSIATVVFEVKAPGEAVLSFDSQSQVFEDGTSRNVLGRTSGTTVKLLPYINHEQPTNLY